MIQTTLIKYWLHQCEFNMKKGILHTGEKQKNRHINTN